MRHRRVHRKRDMLLLLACGGAAGLQMRSRRAVVGGLCTGVSAPSLAAFAETLTAPETLAPATLASTAALTQAQSSYMRPDIVSLVQRPPYGLESEDVFYPEWFLGRWRVTSTLTGVNAPAGEGFFSPGRNGTAALEQARVEIGPSRALEYECRWVRRPDGKIVVDRAFNVASISRASMGARAVQDTQEDGPNHLVMYIQPSGAPNSGIFRADLQVVSRRTDPLDEPATSFACAETVRQSVVLVPGERGSGPPPSPRIKEVEAICTYEAPKAGRMLGGQRTATFLVPDAAYTANPSLAEQQAIQLTRGPGGRNVAIDLRHYDLVYEQVA